MFERLAQYHPLLPEAASILLLLLGAWLSYLFASRILLAGVHKVAARTARTWDDALVENRVGAKLAQLAPIFVIYLGVDLLPGIEKDAEALILNLTSAYIALRSERESYSASRQPDLTQSACESRGRPIRLLSVVGALNR